MLEYKIFFETNSVEIEDKDSFIVITKTTQESSKITLTFPNEINGFTYPFNDKELFHALRLLITTSTVEISSASSNLNLSKNNNNLVIVVESDTLTVNFMDFYNIINILIKLKTD